MEPGGWEPPDHSLHCNDEQLEAGRTVDELDVFFQLQIIEEALKEISEGQEEQAKATSPPNSQQVHGSHAPKEERS